MNKYEQLIEHIINDETDKARELFHNIVVEKSRDIYESLIDEADLDEVGGNKVQGFMDEVAHDEQGISEEEDTDEFEMDSEEDSDMDNDFDASGDLDAHEEEHGDVEDRVQDLESALDELKAEFDALMAGDEGEEQMAGDDMGGMDDMGGEEVAPEEFYEAEEEEEEELEESIVREYVEKVSAPSNTEGADNKQSTVAKKNDMGGSSANIARGGEEKGAPAKKAQPIQSGNINVPGGKAGNAFAKKEKAPAAQAPTSTHSPVAK